MLQARVDFLACVRDPDFQRTTCIIAVPGDSERLKRGADFSRGPTNECIPYSKDIDSDGLFIRFFSEGFAAISVNMIQGDGVRLKNTFERATGRIAMTSTD